MDNPTTDAVLYVFGNLPRLDPAYGDCLVRVRHVPAADGVPVKGDCFVLAHRCALASLPYFRALFERDGFSVLVDERRERQAAARRDGDRPWRGLPIETMVTRGKGSPRPEQVKVDALPDYYAVYEVTVPFCPRMAVQAIALAYAEKFDERQTVDPAALSPQTDSASDPPLRMNGDLQVVDSQARCADRGNNGDHNNSAGTDGARGDDVFQDTDAEGTNGDGGDNCDRDTPADAVKKDIVCAGPLAAIDRALSVAGARLFFGAPHASAFGGPFRAILLRSLKARADRDRAPKGTLTDRGPLGQLMCDALAAGHIGEHIKSALVQRCWAVLDDDEQHAITTIRPDLATAASRGNLAVYRPGACAVGDRVCIGADVATIRRRPGRSDAGTRSRAIASDTEWLVAYFGDPWTQAVYLCQQPCTSPPRVRRARLSGWVYHPLAGRRRLLRPTYSRGSTWPIDEAEWERAVHASKAEGIFGVPGPCMYHDSGVAVYPDVVFCVDSGLVRDGALLAFEFAVDFIDAPSSS
ncbi:hypothetical protein pqer_cds_199 [Pandoravirus quercus]|uniref:Uncharacterized protein n=1 Tax=Pandoravirus quercus TaxID=2107709 RepID=A0A2U7U855_9VIRU|nr:hypothetical protein pqer_cds_199 [Pandoravirus quercus]AVK74621.1 hypothetical protein pqer_cds_199 [Pandoravirus quercus]